ncbi:hypothetical protein L596_014316 [Steinernema carpocapsae]|uniref:Uncharacterized protein n=1 Tax=Steinernema carpocapsae TaxID=34508 RepID=A0A4U5NBL9_STECR|nr:hypothetical protein L596_014316 [Steinernema carpocapsae]
MLFKEPIRKVCNPPRPKRGSKFGCLRHEDHLGLKQRSFAGRSTPPRRGLRKRRGEQTNRIKREAGRDA